VIFERDYSGMGGFDDGDSLKGNAQGFRSRRRRFILFSARSPD
jgi:hypothetical protein